MILSLFETINLNYSFSLIVFNILIYILLSTALFIIILIVVDRSFSTLNKLKNLQGFYSLFLFALLFLMSLAGMPPLLGFIGKFLLYIHLLSTNSYYIFTIFLLFNMFILYFYVQNIRFMVSKNTNIKNKSTFLTHNNYEFIFSFLLLVMFFNIFGIFFFENILNLFFFWFSFDWNL